MVSVIIIHDNNNNYLASQIEYIRCIFEDRCASVDDISSLIRNSNSKKVTLIYWYIYEMMKGDELVKVQKIADDIDTEFQLEVICSESY